MKNMKPLLLFGLFAWLGFASAAVPGKVPAQAYETVNGALQAWKQGNWEKMYGFLSVQDRNKIPLDSFIKKRTEIAIIEKLISYSIVSGRAASDGSMYPDSVSPFATTLPGRGFLRF